jgi:anti-anti-sigma factor
MIEFNKQPHVGFAIGDTRHGAWAFMQQGAVAQAKQLGIRLTVISATTRAEQSSVVREFIDRRVDGLIISSLGDVEPDCEAGHAAGIPVVTCEIGNTEKRPSVVCDVRQDLRTGARLVAQHLLQHLGEHDSILHLAAPDSRLRTEGFHEAVACTPTVRTVEAMGNWMPLSNIAAVRAALTANSDIRAIFAHNDWMALDAVQAVEELGRTGEILIGGVDALPQAIQAIHERKMSATIDGAMQDTGSAAVKVMAQVLSNESVPPFIDMPARLITLENVTAAAVRQLTILPALIMALAESSLAQRQLQEETIASQRDIIQELSTPIIPINNQVLVMPLIGTIDSLRAQTIMSTMLQAIERSHAKVLLLDITGVSVIDTAVANYLLLSAQAARLLGVQVVLVGIKPEVAQTVVQLGIDLSSMVTKSTLQFGLEYATAWLAERAPK